MTFTSFEFVIFFTLVLLGRELLPGLQAKKWFLIIASLVFYGSWNVPSIFLIVCISISDYILGRKISETNIETQRRRLLFAAIALDVGLLGFFKYSNFFVENLCSALRVCGLNVAFHPYNIPLPPAISYFIFASLSYLIDVYYERTPANQSATDQLLFLSFFPKLLSGPIVRARELLPQLKERKGATLKDFEIGLNYFLIGAIKKLVIADQVAGHVNLIFSNPGNYDAATLVQGALGYTVQIYCDFSGYSDMAIGCARMLGYTFPQNFQMPFSSASITEFWRRWHITLSQWFRDYVFLPLELKRRAAKYPTFRVTSNMTITMLLCGLWHGASWTFVIWGGIHGIALGVHKVWSQWNPMKRAKKGRVLTYFGAVCAHCVTVAFIVFSMIVFRADTVSSGWLYMKRMFSLSHGMRLGSPFIAMAVFVTLMVHLVVNKDRDLALELPERPMLPRLAGYSALLLILVLFASTDAAPFIYVQF